MHEEKHTVEVLSRGLVQNWPLDVHREGREWLLTLTAPEQSWVGSGPDVFEALRSLRRQLDEEDIRLGCAGARPNAWSSGMQRDMGVGRSVYLTEVGVSGRPPHAGTLDPASLAETGTVAEQDEFHARWLASRAAQDSS